MLATRVATLVRSIGLDIGETSQRIERMIRSGRSCPASITAMRRKVTELLISLDELEQAEMPPRDPRQSRIEAECAATDAAIAGE